MDFFKHHVACVSNLSKTKKTLAKKNFGAVVQTRHRLDIDDRDPENDERSDGQNKELCKW